MLTPRQQRATAFASGGVALWLFFLLVITSASATQGQGEAPEPCTRDDSGAVLSAGMSFTLLEPMSKEVTVRPGDVLSFTHRIDICTVADVPSLSSDLRVDQTSPFLSIVEGSANLRKPGSIAHQLRVDDRSSRPLTFSVREIDAVSTLDLSYQLAVSHCIAPGEEARVALHSTVSLPIGKPREDGSYVTHEFHNDTSIRVTVAPHPATQIIDYTAEFWASDATAAAGETRHFQLVVTNTGTVPIYDGLIAYSAPSAPGRALLASLFNKQTHLAFNRTNGDRSAHQPPYIDDQGLTRFGLDPDEYLAISWHHEFSEDFSLEPPLLLQAHVMYDRDGDHMIEEEETLTAELSLAVERPLGRLTLTHAAVRPFDSLPALPGSLVDFAVFITNSSPDAVRGLSLQLDLPVAVDYRPMSGSLSNARDYGPNSRRLTDHWVPNGLLIPALEAGEGLVVRYQGYVDANDVEQAEILRLHASLHLEGSAAIIDTLELPISASADLTLAVDGPDSLSPGQEAAFRIALTNTGNGPLEDVIFSAAIGCGISTIVDSATVSTPLHEEPFRGRASITVYPPELDNLLQESGSAEPYRLDEPIAPRESVEIAFRVRLSEDLQPGEALTSVFQVIGRSGDGYQVESEPVVTLVVQDPATAALLAAFRAEAEEQRDLIVQDTARRLDEQERSIIEKMRSAEWLVLEGVAALIGVLIGLAVGYAGRHWIVRWIVRVGIRLRRHWMVRWIERRRTRLGRHR